MGYRPYGGAKERGVPADAQKISGSIPHFTSHNIFNIHYNQFTIHSESRLFRICYSAPIRHRDPVRLPE